MAGRIDERLAELGLTLPAAVRDAKKFITRAIRGAHRWGRVAALDQIQR